MASHRPLRYGPPAMRVNRLPASLALLLAACGGSQAGESLTYGQSAQANYESALADFRDGDCLDAEPAFRRVRREFPYSRFAALAELRIADCKMEAQSYPEAIQAYRQFVRNRPSHSEVPYARYKVAEAHFRQIPDEWLLSPPAHERDQGPTKEALRQLRRFILDFPEDSRIDGAQDMARRALELLARHELYVAEFYLDRDEPRAAIGRLRTLLAAYEGSGVEPEALLLLGRTYLELRDRDQARQAFEQLVERYPQSGQSAQARSYLDELGS